MLCGPQWSVVTEPVRLDDTSRVVAADHKQGAIAANVEASQVQHVVHSSLELEYAVDL